MTELLTEWDPQLDPSAYEIDPEDAALPEVDASTLPARNPAEELSLVDELFLQDDFDNSELEGLGAGGQIWERAVPRARHKCKTHASNLIGFCLKEIRIINETEALAFDADESLSMCDHVIRLDGGNWHKAFRGGIVYFTGGSGNVHGHIMESLGNAFIATTDFPTGHWGRVGVQTLFERWGYARAYVGNQVNGNVVRTLSAPEPPPKPKYPAIQAEIVDLARLRRRHREAGHPAVSAHLTRAIRELRTIPGI